ncbi:hypothetical protein CVT25_011597 [Psilocybe cyanescens]|uniref:Late embryogenesis abundant protein LEA-2 subgroup domain-containing protein n=1 Tax=Psilocybe cyanescens TaxID=93625 RepID=A0A409X0M1_PSICY|nr:hypothetical protein CVT25_011597 [Psilocybe cyanescens]
MSYRDPYSEHYAMGSSSRYERQPHYAEPAPQQYSNSQSPYPYYDDMADEPASNPYLTNNNNNAQAYKDERYIGDQPDYSYGENAKPGYGYPPVQQRGRSVRSTLRSNRPSDSLAPARKEASGFDQGEFAPSKVVARKSRTPRALREYRYDHQGNLWTKVCLSARSLGWDPGLTSVKRAVEGAVPGDIVLTLALYARPPNITIGDVEAFPQNGSVLQPGTPDGFQVNLGVAISVSNPNYFSVGLKKIDLQLTYPINNTAAGGGDTKDINFKAKSQTDFTFPFHLMYSPSSDPNGAIFVDLSSKCGKTPQNIVINYKITLGIRILIVTVSPVITNTFNFKCPVDISNLGSVIGGISGIGSREIDADTDTDTT